MGKKVLEVKDLVTTFRIGKKEYEVLRGVSFDIEENETLCMVCLLYTSHDGMFFITVYWKTGGQVDK